MSTECNRIHSWKDNISLLTDIHIQGFMLTLPFFSRNTYIINDAAKLSIECRITSIEPQWLSKQSQSVKMNNKFNMTYNTIRTSILTSHRRSADLNKDQDNHSRNQTSAATAKEICTRSPVMIPST